MAVVLVALCDTEAELRVVQASLRERHDVRLLDGGLMPGGHKWWQKWIERGDSPQPAPAQQ